MNTNGIVSLTAPNTAHTPEAFPLSENQIIAPYWSDVDIRGIGQIFYRQTTNSTLLVRATNEIRAAFPTSQNVNVTNLLIVTWDAVGYYNNGIDKVSMSM